MSLVTFYLYDPYCLYQLSFYLLLNVLVGSGDFIVFNFFLAHFFIGYSAK